MKKYNVENIIYTLQSGILLHMNNCSMSFVFLVLTIGHEQVSPTPNDYTTVGGGVFIGGIAVGAVTVLLVEGIVCGVCKLRKHPKHSTSTESPNK